MENKIPLELIKEKLYLLFNFTNMIIVFKHHPSICIEFTDNIFKIKTTYISSVSINFQLQASVYSYIEAYCKNKSINRIEINGKTLSMVLFGPIYEHEKPYHNIMYDCNVINWGTNYFLNKIYETVDVPVYI